MTNVQVMPLLLHPAASPVAQNPGNTTSKEALHVFIAFDDMLAYKCALRTIEHVAQQLGDELEVKPQLCPFDVLESVSWRTLASDEACDSEIVVVSTSRSGTLPNSIRNWLQACCAAKRNSGALLVAMLGTLENDRSIGEQDTVFMRDLAKSAGWEFLSPQIENGSLQPSAN